MIDDIVEMILKEARGRKQEDPVTGIYQVMKIIETQIIGVISNSREEERRKREDEKKEELNKP